ncbi:AT-hook motif nuclear-localized protein 28-like protein [Tanacetum coccineum]
MYELHYKPPVILICLRTTVGKSVLAKDYPVDRAKKAKDVAGDTVVATVEYKNISSTVWNVGGQHKPEFRYVMADPESSVQSVISNDDLLTEILARLPVLSLVLFKSVSKHWFSLIKEANLTFRRILDPVSGLFIYTSYKKDRFERSYSYNFVPLDIRIPTNFTFGPDVHGDFQVLHACNGLLLCLTYSRKLIVYNPSITKMLKVLPEPYNVTYYDYSIFYGGLRMAFDPTKSPHYKVIYADLVEGDHPLDKWVQIQTFSSETGNWSLCGPQFSPRSFVLFGNGVYWNDAFHWINDEFHDDHDGDGDDFFKLDIMNEHPVLTASRIPLTECRLFESGGCLLLVGDKGGAHSGHFTIYEKRNEYSQWSLKYIVNLDDIIKPFPTSWSIWSNVFCIVSEEKEDSFLVMELDKKVVQYKIVSKTLSTISDLGPNGNLVSCFQFIPSFANV